MARGGSRALALVEELVLKEGLALGHGNGVAGDTGKGVHGLGLNGVEESEGSEGAAVSVAVHLGGALKGAEVEVEHGNEVVGLVAREVVAERKYLALAVLSPMETTELY